MPRAPKETVPHNELKMLADHLQETAFEAAEASVLSIDMPSVSHDDAWQQAVVAYKHARNAYREAMKP